MKKQFVSILLALCMVLTLLQATTANASHPNNPTPKKDRWYYLRCMGNYLNIDVDGNAELRDKTDTPKGNAKFRLHYLGNGGIGDAYALETEDGRYLGVDKASNGARVKALVRSPDNNHLLSWQLCGENKPSKDISSLRLMANKDMLLNATGQKKADGTPIILWSHIDKWVCPADPVPDGPEHSEFRFIPADTPAGATAPGTPQTPADGWYSLRFDVHEAFSIIDVIRADLVELNSWNCATPWTRAFYVENKGNNQITLRLADGRYLGVGTEAVSDYGWKVAAVKNPFAWNTYSESLGVANNHRKYSLRPVSDTGLALRAFTVNYTLGDPITVFKHKGDYGRSDVVFWELSGDEIPKTNGWTPALVTQPAPAVIATPS
ncbi:hypothetical protein [Anaerotignum propionicum]|uniref:Uncharacterized protein n=1 Tax=Anaerotignum propionicum DSM 1682 TaxID=991789 RepID=A0A0X1U8N3_ANAPI|nr:hypothetical protein [Anaerotignum propionicum]AMJ41299.1 hypothetical protein CPRO_17090 [Anaerotignum propionicum DSM 1682]SHF06931.1 hypothetical protein SAMN02745151_02688 [[Clostridium] propionicum DSM 1682] [Anaerotignum propionicum DSM 1682]